MCPLLRNLNEILPRSSTVCAHTNTLLLMPRAVLCHEFGPPETLSVEEVEELSDCRPKEAVLR